MEKKINNKKIKKKKLNKPKIAIFIFIKWKQKISMAIII